MSDQFVWTEALLKKRRQRAVAMAWFLFGFAFLLIFISMAQIGANLAKRPTIGIGSSPKVLEQK